MKTLRVLLLQNNNITEIPDKAFINLSRLTTLNISSNSITYLQNGAFLGQENLEYLDLGYNKIKSIEAESFANLSNLLYLFLLDLDLDTISYEIMNDLTGLKALSTSDNRLCCLLSHSENVTCARTSPPSPLDTCGSLYPSTVLRFAGWIIGLSSLCGNVFVLFLRATQKQRKTVQNILTMNLAVADSLMGVYMIIITSADVYFNRLYFLSAPLWRESFPCKLSSFLAFFSSELSVFTLTLITLDRYINIVYPFGKFKMTTKAASFAVVFIWFFTLLFSSVPFLVGYNVPGFYGLSDVCIGLPLHVELGETGRLDIVWDEALTSEYIVKYVVTDYDSRNVWVFSIVTFIGLNMALFLIILICYVVMFVTVKRSSESIRNSTNRNREIQIARKMAFIVGTDFACWMPIIVLGILTQTGLVVLPTSLYAWTVIFIIPINSSINPVLYTFINYLEGNKTKLKTHDSLQTRSTRLSKDGNGLHLSRLGSNSSNVN
ncbi:G-protein coupled receptor GRL101-like [Lytechinus variegatus]|uniref:G-protein coupled receptor GRL101-like n=1 Tax=Lytechinus variegatus TaxID=7654 RepID=UPI001BB11BAE|nr:G-protein coupled receptor GRL101-like [Lytechinus variegatus]